MYQKDLKRPICTGWKIQEIGVFLVEFGGDIVYQHIIAKNAEKLMLQKRLQNNVKNVEARI